MTELVKDHGWLVPPFAKNVECPDCKKQFSYFGGALQFSHLMSLYAIPDEFKAAEALGKAYNSPKKLEKLSRVCRNFALGYDYDKVILPLWLDLFDEVKSELGMYGTAKDKDALFDKIFKEKVGGDEWKRK